MLSLMSFIMVSEDRASPHNLPVSHCRIKPNYVRYFDHANREPDSFQDVLATGKSACPYRRMIDYIKLMQKLHLQSTGILTPTIIYPGRVNI